VEVALRLQDAGIKALSIHARTRHQLYKGEADWSWIQKVKDHPDIEIPIFGNGDVDSPQKAHQMRTSYDVDGIMIGRAAIGNPWIFNQIKHYFNTGTEAPMPSLQERVAVCKRHLSLSIDWKGERTGIVEMRRHYTNYFRGIPNFKPVRTQLVTSESAVELFSLLDGIESYVAQYSNVDVASLS
jgi:tRNA-dihydrouridine synthase